MQLFQSHKQKIKNIKKEIREAAEALQITNGINSIATSGLTSKQLIKLTDGLDVDNFQKITTELEKVKVDSPNIFSESDVELAGIYATMLEDISSAQAALLLHTQELTNEQIRQVLALKTSTDSTEPLTIAEQYKAMTDAGTRTYRQ